MMLRGNLATRPFYNERVVTLLLALVAVVAIALTIWNVTRLRELSARRSALQAQMQADEATAAQVRQTAVAIQNSVDRSTLVALSGSAREANGLIDQRTFSWTTFLSYIEDTIPMGVRLTDVSPEIEDGEIIVTMLLVGRSVEELARFMSALEETGAFYEVTPTVADRTEEQLERATVRAGYAPVVGQEDSAVATASATGAGGLR